MMMRRREESSSRQRDIEEAQLYMQITKSMYGPDHDKHKRAVTALLELLENKVVQVVEIPAWALPIPISDSSGDDNANAEEGGGKATSTPKAKQRPFRPGMPGGGGRRSPDISVPSPTSPHQDSDVSEKTVDDGARPTYVHKMIALTRSLIQPCIRSYLI